jgi:hypothetical protein
MKRFIIATVVFFFAGLAYGAVRDPRFVEKFRIPGSTEVVVVAEGDFEPRSIGSYALRVYGGASENFSNDDFLAGVVWPRNGRVETVRFDDVDGDDKTEIIVVIRSVDSGGYLSADAFRFRERSVEWVASVVDLEKQGDPIQALRDKFNVSVDSRSLK